MHKAPPTARSVSATSATAAWAITMLLLTCLLSGCVTGATPTPPPWPVVKVDLPVSNAYFPAGEGADVANAQCLICHSAGMVLRQPPLTRKEWVGEINKMRNSYGAPLPADQIEALATYLVSINSG